jgi:outer membrane protein assembly factor BamB
MFKINQMILVALMSLTISACTYIDDYVFGKDNTPAPNPLPVVKHKKNVHIDWSTNIGSFKKNTATPDLAPGFDSRNIYVAAPNGKITALNKKTGQVLWQSETHLSLLAGPVVAGEQLIVSGDDSAIYILDRNNGKVLQRVSVTNDVFAKPFVHAGKIYAKTITGVVYCIDLKTGHKDWKYEHTSTEIILKASSSPVFYQNSILVGFSDGSIVGLEPLKGHPIFQQHVSYARGVSEVERLNDVDTNPLIDQDRLYIASYQGEVGAYSIPQSEFIWKRQASTFHDLVFVDSTLVLVSSSDSVWAYHKTNGQVLWTQKALKARGLTAPAIWRGQIWVGDRLGTLHGISPSSGQFIGQLQMPGSIVSSPVIDGDVCYVLTTNGQIHRLSLRK